jgi:hypothetical protein
MQNSQVRLRTSENASIERCEQTVLAAATIGPYHADRRGFAVVHDRLHRSPIGLVSKERRPRFNTSDGNDWSAVSGRGLVR